MMKLNKTVQAKECFMEALSLDVKCYESFQQLIDTEMFTPEEGELYYCLLPQSYPNSTFTRMGVRPNSRI